MEEDWDGQDNGKILTAVTMPTNEERILPAMLMCDLQVVCDVTKMRNNNPAGTLTP